MSHTRRAAHRRNPHAFPPLEHNAIIRERNATYRHALLLGQANIALARAEASGDAERIRIAGIYRLKVRFHPEKLDTTLRYSVMSTVRQRQLADQAREELA